MGAGSVRFFLGRVIKLGILDQDRFLDALREPAEVQVGTHFYSFVNVVEEKHEGKIVVRGQLAKFLKEGEVSILEREKHEATSQQVPNIIIATSRFVYFPDYSGIAYENVWSQIESRQFERIVPMLIREKYQGFFVECMIEPIVDLRAFVLRLAGLRSITKILATVYPPNPLFSPLWKSLKNYMSKRNASEVSVRERAKPGEGGLTTQIPTIAQTAVAQGDSVSDESLAAKLGQTELDVTDAAVLMAADGYGKARIDGLEKGKRVVIRTRENQTSFEIERDAPEEELVAATEKRLETASRESGLQH